MTCPNQDQWILLSMQLHDPFQESSLDEHLAECPECRQALSAARRQHAALIRSYESFEQEHDASRRRLMSRLPADGPRAAVVSRTRPATQRIGDAIMSLYSRRGARAAAVLLPAACVVAAILVYLNPDAHRVFAGAIARIREADTIACQVTMTMKAAFQPVTASGSAESQGEGSREVTIARGEKLYLSALEGVRRDAFDGETPVSTVYTSGERGTLLLDHVHRTYHAWNSDEEVEMSQEIKGALRDLLDERPVPELYFGGLMDDPDRLILALRDLTADAEGELGWDTIDGQVAVGFELSGESVGLGPPLLEHSDENRAELWINADNGLPVRLQIHVVAHVSAIRELPMKGSFEITAVYNRFELDAPLPGAWFEPVVPDDYAPAVPNQTLLAQLPDEAALIDGLRAFSEVAGRYPDSLQTMDLMYEVSFVVGSMQAKHLAAQRQGKDTGATPDWNDFGRRTQGLMFYTVLQADGREPEYFGKEVSPGDTQSRLLTWTLEDGQVRVIYGDLSVATLDQLPP